MDTSLAKHDWVLWGPCGCPFGVCAASYFPTDSQALAEFYDGPGELVEAVRRGMRVELMSHERYCTEVADRMRVRCPHA